MQTKALAGWIILQANKNNLHSNFAINYHDWKENKIVLSLQIFAMKKILNYLESSNHIFCTWMLRNLRLTSLEKCKQIFIAGYVNSKLIINTTW